MSFLQVGKAIVITLGSLATAGYALHLFQKQGNAPHDKS